MRLSDIRLNERNPRTIKGESFRRLCESIKRDPEFMVLRPIVTDDTGLILGGNMRLRACLEMGMDEVPDTWVVKASGLTEEQMRRFILVDNAPEGMAGEWDMDILSADWELPELEELGFDVKDFAPDEDGQADAEPQIDMAEELNKTWQVKTGDLWLIGEHRLLCGDSTKAEDVGRLLGDRKPVLMVTDPPYGVEYDPTWRDAPGAAGPHSEGCKRNHGAANGKVEFDDRADWREAWALFPGDVAYVWHAGNMAHVVAESLIACDLHIRSQIVWAKNHLVIGRGDYHPQHEPCWYCVRKGKPGLRTDDRKQTTLWQIDKPRKSETGHSTQKPLECMARPMRNHDAPEVYDPFLGSGTTMVAAQNLGRKCYGIEISPTYCAVILQRMKDAFPGLDIKRDETTRGRE